MSSWAGVSLSAHATRGGQSFVANRRACSQQRLSRPRPHRRTCSQRCACILPNCALQPSFSRRSRCMSTTRITGGLVGSSSASPLRRGRFFDDPRTLFPLKKASTPSSPNSGRTRPVHRNPMMTSKLTYTKSACVRVKRHGEAQGGEGARRCTTAPPGQECDDEQENVNTHQASLACSHTCTHAYTQRHRDVRSGRALSRRNKGGCRG